MSEVPLHAVKSSCRRSRPRPTPGAPSQLSNTHARNTALAGNSARKREALETSEAALAPPRSRNSIRELFFERREELLLRRTGVPRS